MWIRLLLRQGWLVGAALVCAALALVILLPEAAQAQARRHGISMHGEPALPPGFSHLPFVNPEAPKGGRIVFGQQGTFDSLNAFVVRGVAPDAAQRFVLQSLLYRSPDEPFTAYGLLAREIEMPEDRGFIVFHLDPRARFSDGMPVTAADVQFSFDMLRTHGKPFHRSSLGRVQRVETPDPLTIRFVFGPTADRETPLIIGSIPIFAKHATNPETFPETTFTPPVGSGPYLITDLKPGESITMTRRKDFWAADHPLMRGQHNVDIIRYDYFRDANSLFEAFKAGLSDFRVETDPTRWTTGYDIPAVRDGRIVKRAIRLEAPKGLSAFVFNTRKPAFADARVREALAMMFDFDWANRNLFFGVYKRSGSLFADSDLSASGRPVTERESALLGRLGVTLPARLLDGTWTPSQSDGSGRDRDLARRAVDLLAEAGYALDDGVMRRRDGGDALGFEITVSSRPQERLALNYAKSLQRIGVTARVRLIDDVQYWRRLSAHDVDMVQWVWPVSASPGTEQANRWGSAAADRQGSLNYSGVKLPAIDGAIQAMLASRAREDFVAASRVLDRLVMSQNLVVPLFYLPEVWIAHARGVAFPARTANFATPIEALWREPESGAASRALN
ncbi:MAG: extracellular solute-binding protein [Hyphomicrobiales bacterium]|nr:extracellular solute-binding protein [Hyphomicrobiales bacterium]